MILAHVIALDPTVRQAQAFRCACGVARFAYNWGLQHWTKQYRAGQKPSAFSLKKVFNACKRSDFPWVLESPKNASEQAFTDLGHAFTNFFASCKGKRRGKKVGYPTFKRRGQHDSFYVANDKFRFTVGGRTVRLPVIGTVKIHEPLRLPGKILGGRVKCVAGRWYLAVQVDTPVVPSCSHTHRIVGVDLGLKTAVTTSHGDSIKSPKPLAKTLTQLRRVQRQFSRKVKGSKNRQKAQQRVARIYARMINIRHDFWHKVTTQICRENQTIVLEDLTLAFMFKNRKLARVASDVGLGRFRPLLAYKAVKFGCNLVMADKWFPSTQRCSSCGHTKGGNHKLSLGMSTYVCDTCGVVEDRDLNAALNLEQYPRLEGNWCGSMATQTPVETNTSVTGLVPVISVVDDAGTKPCPSVDTL